MNVPSQSEEEMASVVMSAPAGRCPRYQSNGFVNRRSRVRIPSSAPLAALII